MIADILQIIFADIILSGDNALVIGMAAAGLAPEFRRRAIMIGMLMAAVMWIVFAVITSFLISIKGILVAVNLQTAWLSPPVALSAYFLKGVVPDWDLKDIYLGMMQFMVIQVIGLALIFIFPQLVLWLPTMIYGD
ncbi:MAG: TerC family protein [Candidatus Puniceispirillaceae bacterium]